MTSKSAIKTTKMFSNGRKTNVWSNNKFSNEMHTAVSVAFGISSSVQIKMVENAHIYSLTVDPTERTGAKG